MANESIAEDLAAEVQLSVTEDAEKLESEITQLDELATALRPVVARVQELREDSVTILAVSYHSRTQPAFSGMLYGSVALGVEMKMDGSDIAEITETARTDLGLVDFVDSHLRVRWRERSLMMAVVEEALEASDPELILIDRPLAITRRERLLRTDSPASDDWNALLEELDEFWTSYLNTLQPIAEEGPVIAGLGRGHSELLFSGLRGGHTEQFPDASGDESSQVVESAFEEIQRIGPHRLLARILQPNERTVGYQYTTSPSREQWLPRELDEAGLFGVTMRPADDAELMHFNLPGTEWTTDQLDVLGNTVVQATQARRDGIPLPMWQARKNCKFPAGVLDAYYQKLANRVDTS